MREFLLKEMVPYFAGGTTDNATEVTKELKKTFDKLMEELAMDTVQHHHCSWYGAPQHVIQLGDLYHVDNLIMQWAINSAFGDNNRENHSEIHHCQLLQSLYDITLQSCDVAQQTRKDLLAGTSKSVSVNFAHK